MSKKKSKNGKNSQKNELLRAITISQIKPSTAIFRKYKNRLLKLTKAINNSVGYWVKARINEHLNDANLTKQMVFELSALSNRWTKKANELGKTYASNFAKEVGGYVDLNYKEQLKNTPLKDKITTIRTQAIKQSTRAIYESNLALIKSIPALSIEHYKQRFLQAVSNFSGAELIEVIKDIAGDGYNEKRAKLIARDQIAKATEAYSRSRAKSLGFDYYVWITARDERVSTGKGGHIHLDNKIFKYDSPSAIIDSYGNLGHPGDRVNCRCHTKAVYLMENQQIVEANNGYIKFYEIYKAD